MHRYWSAAFAAVLLTACGSDSTTAPASSSTTHGTLSEDPPLRIASLNAASFAAQLSANATAAQLVQITGVPTCGVDFYYIKFWTVGASGEITLSSGALMVPTGAAPACSGPRPIVLYAHGTWTDKTGNIADITNTATPSPTNNENVIVAATYAAQGYIVVAPNYAGYDISTLGYHPYLDAVQQSGEMIDALTAARTALPNTMSAATSDSGKLFVTGYSQGGHVAMATQRALEAAGKSITAAAPMSGPYALEAFVDAVFFGSVDLDSTGRGSAEFDVGSRGIRCPIVGRGWRVELGLRRGAEVRPGRDSPFHVTCASGSFRRDHRRDGPSRSDWRPPEPPRSEAPPSARLALELASCLRVRSSSVCARTEHPTNARRFPRRPARAHSPTSVRDRRHAQIGRTQGSCGDRRGRAKGPWNRVRR